MRSRLVNCEKTRTLCPSLRTSDNCARRVSIFALEASARYLAAELGPKGIRVHAISPGPLKTRAASGIAHFDAMLDQAAERAPARRLVTIEDVGFAVAGLATDAARLITGDTVYIDGG